MTVEFAQRLIATRRGSTLLGVGAAALAGLLLLLYLAQYRDSIKSSNAAVTVLIAKVPIHKGTSGDIIGSTGLFQTTSIAKDQLQNGVFTDASSLKGRVATTEIYPGQQLTATDFGFSAAGSIGTQLTKDWRGISLPVDVVHGVAGQLFAGDHVDVYIAFNAQTGAVTGNTPVIKLLMKNALILRSASGRTGGVAGGGGGNIVVRAKTQKAAELAWAAQYGIVWMTLRPSANSSTTKPAIVTARSLLLGIPPVNVARQVQQAGG
jgi:Flp pilus assembly protein CpaB